MTAAIESANRGGLLTQHLAGDQNHALFGAMEPTGILFRIFTDDGSRRNDAGTVNDNLMQSAIAADIDTRQDHGIP